MLRKLKAKISRKMLIISLVVVISIGAVIGIASLLPGPMIDVTPSEELVAFGDSILKSGKDADLITGAAVGAPSIDRSIYLNFTSDVGVEDGELKTVQIIAKNTGETEIQPRIDAVLIRQPKIKDVLCSDSFSENSLAPGDELTAELELECSFDEAGDYELNIVLIDQDLNILNTVRAEFTIKEVCELVSN